MRIVRILLLVGGCLLAIPALFLVVSGLVMGAVATAQSSDGYFDVAIDRLSSSTSAITAEELDLGTDEGTPRWVLEVTETDVRLRATASDSGKQIFVGIARESDVDRFLTNVAHDEIVRLDDLEAEFRARSGTAEAMPPTAESFWEVSAAGQGTQEIRWTPRSGRWAVVFMNADGSSDVEVDVNVGVRSSAVVPVTVGLLGLGALLGVLATTFIVLGARALVAGADQSEKNIAEDIQAASASVMVEPYPVILFAKLDTKLSSWKWLFKWFLAIPHVVVMVVLWIAFLVLTVVAGTVVVFTGRYPRSLFDFNVGVLRWGWRMSYYAFSGGLGTDRYPPFSLEHDPSYPASLEIEYPKRLSRALALVKWWLLALPHYLIVALLVGGGAQWSDDFGRSFGNIGLLPLLTLIAATILLFTEQYPKTLFDLIVGLNRWIYRVVAYAAFMTDRYPPFRLDQGGSEPSSGGPTPASPDSNEEAQEILNLTDSPISAL